MDYNARQNLLIAVFLFIFPVTSSLPVPVDGALISLPQVEQSSPAAMKSPLPVRARPLPSILPTSRSRRIPLPDSADLEILRTERPADALRWNPAGHVTAPILLYHRIGDLEVPNRFTVSPDDFRSQMAWLDSNGYTAIPISLLVKALTESAYLPEKPVVITFDDGWRGVYEHAFPIMREFGMVGVVYPISTGIYSEAQMMDVTELHELAAAGWEIGSHTRSHPDLTTVHDSLAWELDGSRFDLEFAGLEAITTFAYPFGQVDETVMAAVQESGYAAAVGLGKSYEHDLWSLFYLSRIEVMGTVDMDGFEALLPRMIE